MNKSLKLIIAAIVIILLAIVGVHAMNTYHRFEGKQAEKLAMKHFRTQQYQQAVKEFTTAIKYQPANYHLYVRRGNSYVCLQQYENAIRDYNAALEELSSGKEDGKAKQLAGLYYLRSQIFTAKEEYDLAIVDLEKALSLQPDNDTVQNNLACMLATSPNPSLRDGRRAVELATKACHTTKWRNANWLDTLASAYAETGNFPKAIQYQQQAIAKASDPGMIAEFKDHLRLYRVSKPYHATQGMIAPSAEKK